MTRRYILLKRSNLNLFCFKKKFKIDSKAHASDIQYIVISNLKGSFFSCNVSPRHKNHDFSQKLYLRNFPDKIQQVTTTLGH